MSPTRSPAAVPTVEGAIVFTDLAGFTEFTAIQGDVAALELLLLQERLVVEALGDRGRIVKDMGDGLMIWFDDACHAVETALTLLERFEQRSLSDDVPLWVRIGVHYGRPALRGEDLIGHDVNLAARIVDLAAPGEVLVSEAAAQQVEETLSYVTFEEVGPVMMKGIPAPVAIYRAVRAM